MSTKCVGSPSFRFEKSSCLSAVQHRLRSWAPKLYVAIAMALSICSNGVANAADETPSTQSPRVVIQDLQSANLSEAINVASNPTIIDSICTYVMQLYKVATDVIAQTPEYRQYQQYRNSPGGQAWLRALPNIELANRVRNAGLEAAVRQIDQDLHGLTDACQLDQFVTEAVSLNSQFQYFTGSESLKQSLNARFNDLVLSKQDVSNIVELRLAQLNKWLASIDDSLLISLETDTDIDSASIKIDVPGISQFDAIVSSIVERSEEGVWNAIAETAIAAGVGVFVGNMSTQLMQANGVGDAFGVPIIGAIITNVGGIAIGFASDAIISRIADTSGKLKRELEANFSQSFSSLYANGSNSEVWKRPLRQLVEMHNQACMDAIIGDLKVDRKWALSTVR